MYDLSDLKWVKNVKRQKGDAWAYSEYQVGDFFNLNWSAKMRTNVTKAAINDLILIFQTLKSPKGTFLTHIVTPITNEVVSDPNNNRHPFTRKVCVIGKADPIESIPKPSNLDFYRPNRGAVCELKTIKDFKTKLDIPLARLQQQILELFKQVDASLDDMVLTQIDKNFDQNEFEEGRKIEILRRHKFYERDPKAIKSAKLKAKNEGRLFCEVCGFNFETTYHLLGEGYIECHHKMPIATGGIRKTKVGDLGIVCSNCHRMLHRKFKGKYLTIGQLKEMYFNNS